MTAVTFTRRPAFPTVDAADLVPYRDAVAVWNEYRVAAGFSPGAEILTPPGANVKLAKGQWPVFGLSLAPARTSGRNVCRDASPACRRLCLATAGNGRYDTVTAVRILRTRFFFDHPAVFVSLVTGELDRGLHAYRDYRRVGWRPNVLSDIPWESVAPVIVERRPRLRAYDYTKAWQRTGTDHYRLTYSRSERTPDSAILAATDSGRNVAVPFTTAPGRPLPRTYLGVRVIDGDETDYRVTDPAGVIVGLRAKGRARMSRYRTDGFVIDAGAWS